MGCKRKYTKPSCDITGNQALPRGLTEELLELHLASCIAVCLEGSTRKGIPGRQSPGMRRPKDIKPTSQSSYGWITGYRERRSGCHEGRIWNAWQEPGQGRYAMLYVGALSCRQGGETRSDLHFTKSSHAASREWISGTQAFIGRHSLQTVTVIFKRKNWRPELTLGYSE